MTALVEAIEVTKRYDGVVALDRATFRCAPGSIHALVGENGAGKSTLVKILSGVIPPDSGTVKVWGRPVNIRTPAMAARLGIVAVFQELSLMPDLTVAENIFITHPPRNRLGLIDKSQLYRRTEQLLRRLGFPPIDPDTPVSQLPLAHRQLVEIAKALARDPQVLIMDEGTSALTVQDVEKVFDLMKKLRSNGRSVIFISHRMDEVEEIADTITIFRDGRNVASFPANNLDRTKIVQLMIGRKIDQVFPSKANQYTYSSAPVMEVKHLSWGNILHDINLSLHKGEILGIGGLEGQGQRELFLSLFGVLRNVRGHIYIDGTEVKINEPSDALKHGIQIALIPEDRKTEGLILTMPVKHNVTLATLNKYTNLLFLMDKKELLDAQNVVNQLKIKVSSINVPVRNLSGGNQQKVVIAKWLLTEAKVYLLYDLTRGIDVGTKHEIYKLMRSLTDDGAGILFFSTDISELAGMCDRVLVMYEGRIKSELSGTELNEENLVSVSLGLGTNNQRVTER